VRIIDGLKDMFVYFQNRRDIIEERKRRNEQHVEAARRLKIKQEEEKIKKLENEKRRQYVNSFLYTVFYVLTTCREEKKRIKKAKKELEMKAKEAEFIIKINTLLPHLPANIDPRTIDDPTVHIHTQVSGYHKLI
jgi:hypothetical protein